MMGCAKAALAAMLLAALLQPNTALPAERAALSASAAWLRWLPNGLPAAGYLVIRNGGATVQRLTGASSPDYSSVMLHRSIRENGVDRMVMASGGVDIAPGESLSLAPGGYHLMLRQPSHPIRPGDTATLHLVFASGASVDVTAKVRPAAATGPE
jgi:copper(I)-binding protein